MIGFVEKKSIDWLFVQHALNLSESANQWSNFGPVSILTEQCISDYLKLPPNRCVVMCSNGTQAIFSLVQMYNFLYKKPIKWVVSSFGFHCAKQGPLADAIVVDCDSNGLLALESIEEDFDGLMVTNPFGVADNLDVYKEFCKKNNKILFCDSASAFDAIKAHDIDEVISFHHTKPWGFGEGGCVIINKNKVKLFRSIINFGLGEYDPDVKPYCTNGKISDISCVFILQRLQKIEQIKQIYIKQYNRIKKISIDLGFRVLIDREIDHIPFCVPLVSSKVIKNPPDRYFKSHKYYKPLNNLPKANDLYSKILNVPCHTEMQKLNNYELKQSLIC